MRRIRSWLHRQAERQRRELRWRGRLTNGDVECMADLCDLGRSAVRHGHGIVAIECFRTIREYLDEA